MSGVSGSAGGGGAAALLRGVARDPQGRVGSRRAFALPLGGRVALSCSAVRVPGRPRLLLCPAAPLRPLLRPEAAPAPPAALRPRLEDGARLEVLRAGRWRRASLEAVVSLAAVADAVDRLTGSRLSAARRASPWFVGWEPPAAGARDAGADLAVAVLREEAAREEGDGEEEAAAGDDATAWRDEARPLERGEALEVVASPYGVLSPDVLRNSVTHGVVSNVVGGGLALTDARCLPGAEGGAVLDAGGRVAGMVALPLRHEGSPVDFNLVLGVEALRGVLDAWRAAADAPPRPADAPPVPGVRVHAPVLPVPDWRGRTPAFERGLARGAALVRRAERSLVLVRVGTSWASGTVLHAGGFVVTNAHLLLPYMSGDREGPGRDEVRQTVTVRVEPRHAAAGSAGGARWHRAEVLYVARGPWDVALLRVRVPFPLVPVRAPPRGAARDAFAAGRRVLVLGHGVFGPPAGLRPTATAGTLARVVARAGGGPLLLQSSAAVHRGTSGGALFGATDGAWLGLVTSNVRHSVGGGARQESVIQPRVNLTIPSPALSPLVRYCERLAAGADPGGAARALLDAVERPPDAAAVADSFGLLPPRDLVPDEPPRPPVPSKLRALVDQLESRL